MEGGTTQRLAVGTTPAWTPLAGRSRWSALPVVHAGAPCGLARARTRDTIRRVETPVNSTAPKARQMWFLFAATKLAYVVLALRAGENGMSAGLAPGSAVIVVIPLIAVIMLACGIPLARAAYRDTRRVPRFVIALASRRARDSDGLSLQLWILGQGMIETAALLGVAVSAIYRIPMLYAIGGTISLIGWAFTRPPLPAADPDTVTSEPG